MVITYRCLVVIYSVGHDIAIVGALAPWRRSCKRPAILGAGGTKHSLLMQAQRLTQEQVRVVLEVASTKARQGDPAGALQVRLLNARMLTAHPIG